VLAPGLSGNEIVKWPAWQNETHTHTHTHTTELNKINESN